MMHSSRTHPLHPSSAPYMVILLVLVCMTAQQEMRSAPARIQCCEPHTSDRRGDPPRGRLPVAPVGFFENRGQIVSDDGAVVSTIKYFSTINGTKLYFTASGFSIVFSRMVPRHAPVSEATGTSVTAAQSAASVPERLEQTCDAEQMQLNYRMDVHFDGAQPDATIEAMHEIAARLNYYREYCRDGITGIRGFEHIRYRDLYPNIDMVCIAGANGMEYLFEVRPGGRVSDIRLTWTGADDIALTEDGSLHVISPLGRVTEGPPHVFQPGSDHEGSASLIPARYQVDGSTVSFAVASHDPSRTLIIDPWSTYFGGELEEIGYGVTHDQLGSILFTGSTKSLAFPVHLAWSATSAGKRDAFVAKLDSMHRLAWATYYGGSDDDDALAVATDRDRSVIIVGHSSSHNLPASNPFNVYNTLQGAYAAKLDTSGMMTWARFIGGYKTWASGVATDSMNNIYVCGRTLYANLPILRAFQDRMHDTSRFPQDAFYMKLTPEGNLIFSSYLGGWHVDAANAIAAQPNGVFAITGYTRSSNFPILNAFQPTFGGGGYDVFVTRFDSCGQPLWSTYLGGTHPDLNVGSESGDGIAIDRDGNILLTGYSMSQDFPTLRAFQSFQSSFIYHQHGFITKFERDGRLVWSTRYSGNQGTHFFGVAVDSSRNVAVCGGTQSTDLPVLNAAFSTPGQPPWSPAGEDGCLVKLDSAGGRLWATYFGGVGNDRFLSVTCLPDGEVIACGLTISPDLPIKEAVQPTRAPVNAISQDVMLASLSPNGFFPVTLLSLVARRSGSAIDIEWHTEREVNTRGFGIERMVTTSTSSGEWLTIGFVQAGGSATTGFRYLFTDDELTPTAMRAFYRLRMIDHDGSIEYSPAIEVDLTDLPLAVRFDDMYPNPAGDWVTISFSLAEEVPVTLTVHSISGAEVARLYGMETLAAGRHRHMLPTAGWQPGLYIYTLKTPHAHVVTYGLVIR